MAQAALPDNGFYGVVTTGQLRKSNSDGTADGVAMTALAGLGYDFNKHFALEVSYMLNTRLKTSVGTGNSYQLDADAYLINALGKWPINDTFKLFAGIGNLTYNAKTTIYYNGSLQSQTSSSKSVMNYSLGGEMALDRRSAIRVQYFMTEKLEFANNYWEKFDGLQASFIARF